MSSNGFPFGTLGLYGALVTYGSLNLTVTSPQQIFTEPITLDEIKSFLKVPQRSPTDPGEDAELTELISAAREQAEIAQNRDLVQKQYDLSLDYWPSYRIELAAPLQSVDLVQYTDSSKVVHTMQADADYIVDALKGPGILAPPYNGTWPTFTPWPSSAILIRFTSGYSSTDPFWQGPGARIKTGMKLLVSAWFNNRLPFERGASDSAEWPYAVTSCLSHGSLVRAR
ncbi:MAG TPA: hypothetical protein VGP83_16955 [Pyrinomonadaceae bacterium]|jgi:uncharacterized phiE125 gp8 family phage protein|nr:hypothetical protein [Pyrinomonadaceae bacterium]